MGDQAETTERPVEFVRSLERGLAVIRAFSADRPTLSLSDVARETGLTRAAARRFLLTLQHLGYVGSNDRYFYLRPAVLRLGYAYLSSFSLSSTAEDHLRSAASDLHESCSASVLDGVEVVYIARASTSRIMAINLAVGTRLPAVHTSMGRVLLGALAPEALVGLLDSIEIESMTERSVTDRSELLEVIQRDRDRGWSAIDQELEIGVRSVAVAVRDHLGSVVASVNASAHASRVSMPTLEGEFLERIRQTATAIEADLAAQRGIRVP